MNVNFERERQFDKTEQRDVLFCYIKYFWIFEIRIIFLNCTGKLSLKITRMQNYDH